MDYLRTLNKYNKYFIMWKLNPESNAYTIYILTQGKK